MADSIAQRFDVACRTYPERTAMFDSAGGAITFEQLFYSVHAFAQALTQRVAKPGALLAFHISEPGVKLALTLAALRLGLKAMLYDTPLPGPGAKSAVDFHVVEPGAQVEAGPGILQFDKSWLTAPAREAPQRSNGGVITGTSGTTGSPRLQGFAERATLGRIDLQQRSSMRPDAPGLVAYNPGTNVGFRMVLSYLFLAQTQIRLHRNAELTLALMSNIGVRYARMPPVAFKALIDATETYGGVMPEMTQIVVGGGTIAPGLAARAEAVFKCQVSLGYGTTETGPVCNHRTTTTPEETGVVGRIVPTFEHKFIDEDGTPAERGELCLKVPLDLRGTSYFNAEGPYDSEGWVATGDVGYIRPDGLLVINGRRSEFINSGGTKRAPHFFEELIQPLPGVREVAAFAFPNEWGSEDVGVAIVTDGTAIGEATLRTALAEPLKRDYNFRLFFVAALPSTDAGKVDRRALAATYRGEPGHLMMGRSIGS